MMGERTAVGLLQPVLQEKVQKIIAAHDRPLQLSWGRHKGCAAVDATGVDIHCVSARDRHRLIALAVRFGIERIGIYAGYIHLDVADLPHPALWVGQRGGGD